MGVIQGDHGIGVNLSFAIEGANGSAVHPLAGAMAGDRVRLIRDITDVNTPSDVSRFFETTLAANDHITQTSGDLSGRTLAVLIVRPT